MLELASGREDGVRGMTPRPIAVVSSLERTVAES